MQNCEWCNSQDIRFDKSSVYWELPDGTKAIEITETPTVVCKECGMNYQEESVIKQIEDQLYLINTKELERIISFKNLMDLPRLLKKNYFDFSS